MAANESEENNILASENRNFVEIDSLNLDNNYLENDWLKLEIVHLCELDIFYDEDEDDWDRHVVCKKPDQIENEPAIIVNLHASAAKFEFDNAQAKDSYLLVKNFEVRKMPKNKRYKIEQGILNRFHDYYVIVRQVSDVEVEKKAQKRKRTSPRKNETDTIRIEFDDSEGAVSDQVPPAKVKKIGRKSTKKPKLKSPERSAAEENPQETNEKYEYKTLAEVLKMRREGKVYVNIYGVLVMKDDFGKPNAFGVASALAFKTNVHFFRSKAGSL